jgi:hypothetical protein
MTLTAILVLVVAASSAAAQRPGRIPQDPAALTFDASPDHDAVDANGPRVLKYLIDFSPIEGLGTAKTVDIGKPAPQAGTIRVPLATLGLEPGRYMAQVRVLGPTTSAVSGVVGPFQLGEPKAPPIEPSEDPNAQQAPPPAPAAAEAPNPDLGKTDGNAADGKKKGFWRRLYGLIVGQ